MSVSGKVARNSVVLFAGKVATLACSLLLVRMLTREMGPLGFGRYVVALVYAQLFGLAADLGVNVMVLRRLATPQRDAGEWVGMALGLRLATVTTLVLVAAAVAQVTGYDAAMRGAILAALLITAVQGVNSLFVAVLQARLESHHAALAEVVGRLATLGFTFGVLRAGGGVVAVLLAQALGVGIQLAWTALAAVRVVRWTRLWQPGEWRGTLAQALPVGISTLLGFIYFKADTLLLSRLPLRGGRDNGTEVGVYGAAYKVLEIVLLVPGIFLGTLFPVLADAVHRGDRARLGHLVDRAVRIMLYFGTAAAAALWLYAGQIIEVVAGPTFAQAVTPLRILSWGVAANFVATVFTYSSLALGRQARLAAVYGTAAVLNIIANLILIPRYSYVGAAWVTVFTEVLVALGAVWVCGPVLPLGREWRSWGMPLTGVGASLACAWVLLRIDPWLSLASGAIVLVAAAHVARVVRVEEVRRAFTRRTKEPAPQE